MQALRVQPDNMLAYVHRGLAAKMGHFEEATPSIKQSLEPDASAYVIGAALYAGSIAGGDRRL